MEKMRSICVRFNTKVIFTILATSSVCLLVSLWMRQDCGPSISVTNTGAPKLYKEFNDFDDDIEAIDKPEYTSPQNSQKSVPYSPIPCVINGDSRISCRREDGEVYVPFSFLHQYFEVYGSIVEDGGVKFDWQHSYSIVYPQEGKYEPTGVFMSFEHYNVETRSRVKCITATDDVPLSMQWGPNGYYYAIQIAQYGLSHYSKHIIDDKPRVISLDDFESGKLSSDWSIPRDQSKASIVYENGARMLEFNTDKSLESEGIVLAVGKKAKFVLSLNFRFVNNGSIAVVLKTTKNERVTLSYVQSTTVISLLGNDVVYGLGNSQTKWRSIHRDIVIDYTKGVLTKYKKSHRPKLRNLVARIVSVNFYGHGYVDNILLSTSSHMTAFYSAADWLVKNQDTRGGWPIMVARRLVPGVMELKPGWYSAMAQGQAMSVLVRAYAKTKQRRYLNSAMAAIKLFTIPSGEGGIATKFAGIYDWYEEYPTVPSSFVLNGFIFSLIGLYDLKEIGANEPEIEDVRRLYVRGMTSLRALLNLYDTGSGSVYDLRHYSAGLAPNLARWDYHATHVIQLNLLATIDSDQIFRRTADRWHGYMKGLRAEHN